MNTRQQQLLANGMTFMLVVAIGLQLSWWSWHFFGPASQAIGANASVGGLSRDIALARQLFGGDGSSPAAIASAVPSDIRLKGVFSVDGATLSAAVVNVGGKDQAVKLNQDLPNGAKLVEVHPAYIVVSRNGVNERVDMDSYRLGGNAASAANQTGVGAGPGAGQGAAAARSEAAGNSGFRLNVASPKPNSYSLSRLELNTVLQDPRQMEFLGRIGVAPGGGVRVDDAPANSLSNKLGLQAGDVITNINGQPVASPGDLARLYSQFGTLSQIRVEVKRGGAPTLLTYAIQN